MQNADANHQRIVRDLETRANASEGGARYALECLERTREEMRARLKEAWGQGKILGQGSPRRFGQVL